MNDNYKYKAFISYSHKDERWATWLHRAIESYRLPKKLVGSSTPVGIVPKRLYPVFRDRDDLSSSSDLSSTVVESLFEAENLVIICSPHSADSDWVNQEIREFIRLGRQENIFCVIVKVRSMKLTQRTPSRAGGVLPGATKVWIPEQVNFAATPAESRDSKSIIRLAVPEATAAAPH